MLESLQRINRSVQRAGAVRYLLLMLISFALSVTLTRVFLNLTGFPKLGGGNFHIAHVLWGGLFLYIAAVLPLQFANRWVYSISAVFTGFGMGLFMDEVGKFITSNNDYFYPPAAPIIYSFFIIASILYMQSKKNNVVSDKAALYHAFDLMEEVLEHELDKDERTELISTLLSIREKSEDPQYRHLADELLHFVESEKVTTIDRRYFFTDRIYMKFDQFRKKFFTRKNIYLVIILTTLVLSGYLFIYPFRFFWSISSVEAISIVLKPYIESQLITPTSGLDWLTGRVILEAMIGLILLVSSILLIFKKENLGISLAYLGMILLITTLNLLIFYYDQFSSIGLATIHILILLLIIYYRTHFLSSEI